jgi:hypothetical protein
MRSDEAPGRCLNRIERTLAAQLKPCPPTNLRRRGSLRPRSGQVRATPVILEGLICLGPFDSAQGGRTRRPPLRDLSVLDGYGFGVDGFLAGYAF